jgi:hypothetical protein
VATGSLLGAAREEATYSDLSGDQLDFFFKRSKGFGEVDKLALSFPGGDWLSGSSGVIDSVVAELSAPRFQISTGGNSKKKHL